MCAAIVPSASATKIMVMKPADEDGSLTAATMFITTHGRQGYQSSAVLDEFEETQSQPPPQDTTESPRIDNKLQASTALVKTLPTEDFSRREIPPYSLLLYRPGVPMEHPPLILTTTSEGAGAPILADILTSQSLAESQVLVTTSAAIASASTDSVSSSTHSVDPAWLQVLSGILSASTSEGKTGEGRAVSSAAVSETQACPVASISVPHTGLTTGSIQLKGTSLGKMEAVMKIPLAELTNKLTRHQMSAHVLKDGAAIQGQLGSHSHSEFVPAFVNKSQCDSIVHPSVTCSVEENQTGHPHETRISSDQVIGRALGTSRLLNVNMPMLTNSPLSFHEASVGPIRESHNLKERRRRARIKDACNLMRQLVPGMSHRTDKATVFEFSARYIHFLKSFVGSNKDKEFLVKYSPY
ncbi:hypothetical protein BsWGS_06977 [Bradybaena similaris]